MNDLNKEVPLNNFEKLREYAFVPNLEISTEEKNDRKALMRRIFEVQSSSRQNENMYNFIFGYVNELIAQGFSDISIDDDIHGNIYVVRGNADTYPCIVSHIDTVHDIIPDEDYIVIENDTEFFAIDKAKRMPTGIGGDDNCGIYCCLDNLFIHDNIKLAFFVDEEIGCIGSSKCHMDFFHDVSFVLQADRQGYNDVVNDIMYIDMFGDEFLAAIRKNMKLYNRSLTSGGMTDVMQLAENGLEVAMANFSCGYYEPHSKHEYVVIDELILTSILFRDIIDDCYQDGFKYIYKRDLDFRHNSYNYGGYYDGYGSYNNSDSYFKNEDNWSKHHHGSPLEDNPECKKCGCLTMYDIDANMYFCNNCMDYDYGRGVVHIVKPIEPEEAFADDETIHDDYTNKYAECLDCIVPTGDNCSKCLETERRIYKKTRNYE